jgi:hypothetical protein
MPYREPVARLKAPVALAVMLDSSGLLAAVTNLAVECNHTGILVSRPKPPAIKPGLKPAIVEVPAQQRSREEKQEARSPNLHASDCR